MLCKETAPTHTVESTQQFRSLAVILTATLLAIAPALAGSSRVEIMTAGTDVPVHLLGSISSGSTKVNETFSFAAAQDIQIDGRIAIRKGAQGEGEIANVQKASGSGRSGAIGLRFKWIYAVDGGKVRLSDAPQANVEEDRKGASSTATIVGLATFGISGLFGHNFAHGREMIIDKARTLHAFAASNVHIATTKNQAAADIGYDQ